MSNVNESMNRQILSGWGDSVDWHEGSERLGVLNANNGELLEFPLRRVPLSEQDPTATSLGLRACWVVSVENTECEPEEFAIERWGENGFDIKARVGKFGQRVDCRNIQDAAEFLRDHIDMHRFSPGTPDPPLVITDAVRHELIRIKLGRSE